MTRSKGMKSRQNTSPPKEINIDKSSRSRSLSLRRTAVQISAQLANNEPSAVLENNSLKTNNQGSELSELTKIIKSLCLRVADLEKTVQDQTSLITKFETVLKQTVVENSTQTDEPISVYRTYADAAKAPPSPSSSFSSNKACVITKEKAGGKENRSVSVNASHTINVTSKKTHPRHEEKKEKKSLNDPKNSSNLPEVIMVHDSILSGVNATRLGRSYGFKATARKAYNIEDISSSVTTATSSTETVDAIVIHCGLNSIKRADPQKSSEIFVNKVKQISADHPQSKIVISKVAPVQDAELEVRRNLFNALNSTKLYNNKNISFVDHANLYTNKSSLRDGMHPTTRGASVLAGNVGRHVRDLFWIKPTRPSRRRPPSSQRVWGLSPYLSHSSFPSNIHAWQNSYEALTDWY